MTSTALPGGTFKLAGEATERTHYHQVETMKTSHRKIGQT